MEQKNINMETDDGTPAANFRIEAPIVLNSLYVLPGTKITLHGRTFLCVEQPEPVTTSNDGEDIPAVCADCDAPWTLCHMIRCSPKQRPDRISVHFKIIARHE